MGLELFWVSGREVHRLSNYVWNGTEAVPNRDWFDVALLRIEKPEPDNCMRINAWYEAPLYLDVFDCSRAMRGAICQGQADQKAN